MQDLSNMTLEQLNDLERRLTLLRKSLSEYNSKEEILIKANGQWSLEKMSNYNGYDPKDNIKRKARNVTSVGKENTGANNQAKEYTTTGSSQGNHLVNEEAKRQRKKNKVKVYTPEELAEFNAARTANLNKDEDTDKDDIETVIEQDGKQE